MPIPAVQSSPNSRRAQRFLVSQIVAVRSIDGELSELSGWTRNVSACGIFFCADRAVPEGARVELFMMMPIASFRAASEFPLHASGQVVRMEAQGDQFGIAVQLDHFDVLAEA